MNPRAGRPERGHATNREGGGGGREEGPEGRESSRRTSKVAVVETTGSRWICKGTTKGSLGSATTRNKKSSVERATASSLVRPVMKVALKWTERDNMGLIRLTEAGELKKMLEKTRKDYLTRVLGVDSIVLPASFQEQALARLTTGLSKGTQQNYACIMRAFDQYVFAEADHIDNIILDPNVDHNDVYARSKKAEELMMGFVEWLMAVRGVQVKTAASYTRVVLSRHNTRTGLDLTMGMKWRRLKALYGRWRNVRNEKKKRRDGMMQQHIRQIFETIDQVTTETSRPFTVLSQTWGKLKAIVQRLGPDACKAVLSVLFFGVSRAGDMFAQTKADFDPKVDSTVSDLSSSGGGVFLLRFKRTKTGLNPDFGAKLYVEDENNAICPMTAWKAYAEKSKLHLLSEDEREREPFVRDSSRKPWSVANVRELVKAGAAAIELNEDYYGAHSLRIGGATSALLCSEGNEYVTAMMGYWCSEAMRSYTRPTRDMMLGVQKAMMRTRETKVLVLEELE